MAGSITLNAVTSPQANTAFPVSGTLSVTPTLTFTDDAGSAQALPAGSTVPTPSGTFSFTHPGLASGSHTVAVKDGVTGASGSVAVTVQQPVQQNGWAFITPGTGSFKIGTDTYTLTSAGAATKNGTAIPGGSGTAMMASLGGHPYGLDAGGSGWYQWTGSTWTPATVSASGATVTDANGFLFASATTAATMTIGGQIAFNGTVDAITQGVLLLLFYNGVLWQEVTGSNWYSYSGTPGNWAGPITTDPRTSPPPPPPPTGQFTLTDQGMFDPSGARWSSRGINVLSSDMVRVTLAKLNADFPGCNRVRLAVGGEGNGYKDAEPLSQIVAWVNAMTNNGAGPVVVRIENHDGSNTTPYTGAALSAESAWYASLASALKGNAYAQFATMNEPGAAGLSAQQRATYLAIRGTGNMTPVFFLTVNGNPAAMPDDPTAYHDMVNVGWEMHPYNWEDQGNTNQAQVNAQYIAWANQMVAWTTCANPGGKMLVDLGEGGDLDYNNNPNVDVAGGDGENQIITMMYTVGQQLPFVGCAFWLWAGLYAFGNAITDAVNESTGALTARGQFIRNNGFM